MRLCPAGSAAWVERGRVCPVGCGATTATTARPKETRPVHANAPLTAEGRRRLVARVLVLGPPRLGRRPAAASYLDRADRELGRALGRGLAPAQRRAVGAANPAWAVCRTVGRGGRLQSADDDGVELGLQPSARGVGAGVRPRGRGSGPSMRSRTATRFTDHGRGGLTQQAITAGHRAGRAQQGVAWPGQQGPRPELRALAIRRPRFV